MLDLIAFGRQFGVCHFGGGGSAVPPVQPPVPPVTPDNAATLQVQQNMRRQQANRKNLSSTIYAGATGGWSPTIPSGTQAGNAPSVGGGATKTG